MNKPKRNELCPYCDSGLKYKYCCISKERRPVRIPIDTKCDSCGNDMTADFTNDILNIFSSAELPLKTFCKDNDIYLFGISITVRQSMELGEQLKNNTLTKSAIIETFKSNFKRVPILGLLDAAIEELDFFKKREEILKDAFSIHFDGKYTLSIPTLFAQLEGLLRDVGNLKNAEKIKPTIPRDIWEKRLLMSVKDNAQNFNSFIHTLFEGSKKDDKFNRNPILHGFKNDYYSEEHSMLLILSILEIRMFYWWKNKIPEVQITKKK